MWNKLKEYPHSDGMRYMFYCPGCQHCHIFKEPEWTYNGDPVNPTFTPSLLNRGQTRCHLFLTDGKIHYLPDCDHELAGQTVEMIEQ